MQQRCNFFQQVFTCQKKEERGKTVYVAICRQNEKGENGRCSEIESAIVP
ncbi:MAG: hypothetical protein LBF19_03575 [Prevotellaceae bacterium]|nr:hypothetical protein [Prevotellaceae bacterium]